jgi:hypothetical protein
VLEQGRVVKLKMGNGKWEKKHKDRAAQSEK